MKMKHSARKFLFKIVIYFQSLANEFNYQLWFGDMQSHARSSPSDYCFRRLVRWLTKRLQHKFVYNWKKSARLSIFHTNSSFVIPRHTSACLPYRTLICFWLQIDRVSHLVGRWMLFANIRWSKSPEIGSSSPILHCICHRTIDDSSLMTHQEK